MDTTCTESSLTSIFLQYPKRKNSTHFRKKALNNDLLGLRNFGLKRQQNRVFLGIQQQRQLDDDEGQGQGKEQEQGWRETCLVLLLDLEDLALEDLLARTWPMQVTLGEDGSC